MIITRRGLLEAVGGALAGGSFLPALAGGESEQSDALWLSPLLPQGTRAEAALDTLPGKKPLIKLTYRPPNYESPLAYLRTPITPNDEFFVRYHLADIPEVDAGTWKLNIGGDLVGLNKEAVEVVFDGADGPVLDKTPDLVKSLLVWKAIEESTLVAYEMNGEPLPHWNGFPARIVAPGWTGTG